MPSSISRTSSTPAVAGRRSPMPPGASRSRKPATARPRPVEAIRESPAPVPRSGALFRPLSVDRCRRPVIRAGGAAGLAGYRRTVDRQHAVLDPDLDGLPVTDAPFQQQHRQAVLQLALD